MTAWCFDPPAAISSGRFSRSSRRSPMVRSTLTPSLSPRFELGSASTASTTLPERRGQLADQERRYRRFAHPTLAGHGHDEGHGPPEDRVP